MKNELINSIHHLIYNNVYCSDPKSPKWGPPVGFGMDTPRMGDIMGISDTLGVPYYYIVKQVNNQYERNFVDWQSIEIHDFFKATESTREIQGGTGMATAFTNQHPTLVAPIEKYARITDNFEGFYRDQ